MSPDEFALMQAIRANPADDLPRLVFADFLEERGDESSVARAEFIRVQCSGTNPERAEALLVEFRERWDELMRQYLSTIYPGIRFGHYESNWNGVHVLDWSYRRGMISSLEIVPKTIHHCIDLPRHLGPFEHLSVSTHLNGDGFASAALDGWNFDKLKVLNLEGGYGLDFLSVLPALGGRVVHSVPILHLDYDVDGHESFRVIHANRVFQGRMNPVVLLNTGDRHEPTAFVSDPLNLWPVVRKWAEEYFPFLTCRLLDTDLTVAQRGLLPTARLSHLVHHYKLAGLPPPPEIVNTPYPLDEREPPPKRTILARAARWFRRSRP